MEEQIRHADISGAADPMPPRLAADLEKERQSSARLMDKLSESIKANIPSKEEAREMLHDAGTKVQDAARYVREHYLKEVTSGVEGYARRRPAASLAVAAAAGFLLGRALRSR